VFALSKGVFRNDSSLEELRRHGSTWPQPGDYLLANCREQWRVFPSEDELRRFASDASAPGL
jgi:hypothetical protein